MLEALKAIWQLLDYLCGKRLVAILPESVPILERHGELKVDEKTRQRLAGKTAVILGAAGKKRVLHAMLLAARR